MSTSTTEAKPLLRAEDIAERLAVAPRTILWWSQQGDMPAPAIDRPRCKRWRPEDIDRWLATGRTR